MKFILVSAVLLLWIKGGYSAAAPIATVISSAVQVVDNGVVSTPDVFKRQTTPSETPSIVHELNLVSKDGMSPTDLTERQVLLPAFVATVRCVS
jgi:hypothetical protein